MSSAEGITIRKLSLRLDALQAQIRDARAGIDHCDWVLKGYPHATADEKAKAIDRKQREQDRIYLLQAASEPIAQALGSLSAIVAAGMLQESPSEIVRKALG